MYTKIVSGISESKMVASRLIESSVYFKVMPLPGDQYEFAVKQEVSRILDREIELVVSPSVTRLEGEVFMQSSPIIYRQPLINPQPIPGTAVLCFKESGWEELKSILDSSIYNHFEYRDQDGLHYVRLEGTGEGGLVTLIDLNKRTGQPKAHAHPYTVCLYTDGELTMVTK